MSNDEFRAAIIMLAQAITSSNTPTLDLRMDFPIMNYLECHGSKVDKNLYIFIDEVYKMAKIMGVSSKEKIKLEAYQHKGVAQVWFTQ